MSRVPLFVAPARTANPVDLMMGPIDDFERSLGRIWEYLHGIARTLETTARLIEQELPEASRAERCRAFADRCAEHVEMTRQFLKGFLKDHPPTRLAPRRRELVKTVYLHGFQICFRAELVFVGGGWRRSGTNQPPALPTPGQAQG